MDQPAQAPLFAVPAIADSLTGLGQALASQLDAHTEALTEAMATGIPGLPGDPAMRRLLYASVRSNLEAASNVYRGSLSLERIDAPAAALDYARRLAQLEAPPNALARAYRWGHFMTSRWAAREFTHIFADPADQLAALHQFDVVNFWYIDHMSERVLAEYQSERDRWLAHRSTVRSEALRRILEGEEMSLQEAEAALSYRLAQFHVGAIIWTDDPRATSAGLAGLETTARGLAAAIGTTDRPLFWALDATTAWVWVPWSKGEGPDLELIRRSVAEISPQIRVAVGAPGRGLAGFRDSHRDAALAADVCRVAGSHAPTVVSADEPGVRTAALLAADLEGVTRLVSTTLGGLAVDTPVAARLRETLRVYLEERGSLTAAAQRLHVHKNTVGNRIAQAVEELGRPPDANRADVQLALVVCQWLGPAVLSG